MVLDGLDKVRSWLDAKLELSRGGGSRTIRSMEGLRGFAALLVFGVHYAYFIAPYLEHAPTFAAAAERLSQVGNTGVDLFFVLSGYLIYGSLMARAQPFGPYLARRVTRVYPVFLVVFAVYAALSYVVPGSERIPQTLPDAVLYYAANLLLLGPLLVPVWPLVPVAWSLSYEVFFYALAPLLVTAFSLRRRSAVWRVTFFVLLAGLFLAVCAFFPGRSRLATFAAGVLLYEALRFARLRVPSALTTAAVCAAGFGTYLALYRGRADVPLSTLVLSLTFFTLCFHLFSPGESWLRRAFEWTPLRRFGNMSYSFYLTHVLSMNLLTLLLPGPGTPLGESAPLVYAALLPLFFLVSWVPAFALFVTVERPLSFNPRRNPLPPPQPAEAARSRLVR